MDAQEIQILEPMASPIPGRLVMRFRVPKSHTRPANMPTPEVTTFSDCDLPNKIRVDEFGDYVFVTDQDGPSGYHEFIFAPALTREQAQTPYRSRYETEPSMYWPKVLLSLQRYKRAENDVYILRPRYKEAYQGPTRVLIEEFYSPSPFEIQFYEPMQERGLSEEIGLSFAYPIPPGDGTVYWLSVGTLNLDSCLHAAINVTVPLDPPLTIGAIDYTEAYLTDTATNYEDWPDTLVIYDKAQEVLGGWKRRRVTALRPMIVRVTLPTSASISSTGATLGGTVAIQDNAVVTSRGVVYALTAQDANPEVGNSQATSAATTGTTGTYTQAVTGLTPSSNYSFKPWAMTSQGVRVYGPVGTFTTSAP
jgi:hypothetical protein